MWKLELNWLRGLYIVLFFCNAIVATLFKTIGEDTLSTFGTFDECDQTKNASCRGNQMIFRASFSISFFFLLRALLSRFGCVYPRSRAMLLLFAVELPVFVGLLVGSFYLPSSFFSGYVPFTRVASGFFILFQIFCIVSLAYQARDILLDRIESAEEVEARGGPNAASCCNSPCLWKTAFLGLCTCSLVMVAVGVAYLYLRFGGCSLGVVFTTITVVVAGLTTVTCISTWLDVGLLPPCVISAYLVFMCWQALVSNPNKSCEQGGGYTSSSSEPSRSADTNSMVANAVVAAFAMTWTSWRTSSAATKMFARRQKKSPSPPVTNRKADASRQFSGAVVLDVSEPTALERTEESHATASAAVLDESPLASGTLFHEPWQFYCMMCVAGLYMAMVLTDWDSADGSSNSISMWVKIVAQWVTMLLFTWTLVAPKLFPDRDFRTTS